MLQIQQIKMQPTSRTVTFLTSHLPFYNYNFTMMQAGQQSKRMISALEHIVYILNIEQDTVLKNGLNLFIKFTLYKTVPSEY